MQTMRAQPSCSGRYQALSSRNCNANRAVLRARVQPRSQVVAFKVEAAISRAKKEEIVAEITEKLSSSVLVYGMRYKGVTVKQVERMRRDLPPGANMYVTKNRLLRVAVEQMGEEGQKWEGLKGQKGDNAWIFADENSIRGSVEAYNKFFKELKDLQVIPKGGPAPPPPTEITTIVLDGQVMGPKDIAKLEKIPTKAELLTMIARGIKANPTKIATAIAAVPRKLAYGIKALSELNDDKTMTVEQAVAAKAAAGN